MLGQGIAVIAHAGAGLNAGIGDLDRTVQSSGAAGRQRIHHDQHIRLRLLHHTAYDFCRLHTGLRHYPRLNTADQIHTGTVVGCFAVGSDHVSGDQQIVHHLRSQSVCRHFPVSQPHDQYRQFLRFPGHHFQKFLR